LQRGVSAVEQRLHDGSVSTGVHARHLYPVVEERKILERDCLIGVVTDDVVHHLVRG
ncbi:MAG: hypothetical protein Q9214_001688, partial [Letrouitia sp. 1 TL-2023]